jgi:uncharacterized protein (DUF1800 family)
MFSLKRIPRFLFWLAAVVLIAATIPSSAQGDPDPNSPTPILLSVEGSPRVLAHSALKSKRYTLTRPAIDAFKPNMHAVLYVADLDLMENEGANAFRVYARDAKGRSYRFPVTDIRPAAEPGVHALTIRLRDEVRYWSESIRHGDLIVRISWRGLTSNELLMGYGSTGGKLSTSKNLKISPYSQLKAKTTQIEVDGPNATGIGYKWSGDRIRFLEQASFGPTVMLDSRVRRIGLRTWLGEQFSKPYPTIPYPDIPLKSTNTEDVALGCGPAPNPSTLEYRVCIRDHYSMYPVQKWFFSEALYGDAQLRHRVAWALAQIWVISGVDTQQSSWMIAYHKVLSANAFGNYRTLMKEMTLNPGMGNYLDMARSTRNNPNENYPREILQLFAVGLFELNQDGTLKLDINNNPIPTYDQEGVNNFTKVFTGWSFCNTGCPNSSVGVVNYKDPMILTGTSPNFGSNHDLTAKTLFNYPGAPFPTIPACSGCTGAVRENYAKTSLEQTLDNIFHHPNVAPFVSKILIQHLVTSDPSPAYVGRVAAVFNNNGYGVRGDLKEVVRAILLDPEARGDAKTDPNFGKLREPVQLMTNLFRQIGVKGAGGVGLSDGVVNNLSANIGQNTFNSPTVFNFYSPDNVIPGTTLLGPEFALMTTGTSIGRANLANTMVFNQINVGENAPQGTSLDLAELQALAAEDTTSNRLLDVLNQRMMHNTMSANMRNSILTAVNSITSSNPLQRARQAVYLVATSSQYQVQR